LFVLPALGCCVLQVDSGEWGRGRVAELTAAGELMRAERDALLQLVQALRREYEAVQLAKESQHDELHSLKDKMTVKVGWGGLVCVYVCVLTFGAAASGRVRIRCSAAGDKISVLRLRVDGDFCLGALRELVSLPAFGRLWCCLLLCVLCMRAGCCAQLPAGQGRQQLQRARACTEAGPD
jgi:hypothetical protein